MSDERKKRVKPIRPEECAAPKPELSDRHIEFINILLENHEGKPVIISCKALGGVDKEALMEAYGEAGWSVKFVPDQRDGNYFVFEAMDPAEPAPEWRE